MEELISRYLELVDREAQLKKELEEVGREKNSLAEIIFDELTSEGMRSVTTADGVTLSVRPVFIPSIKDHFQAWEWLKNNCPPEKMGKVGVRLSNLTPEEIDTFVRKGGELIIQWLTLASLTKGKDVPGIGHVLSKKITVRHKGGRTDEND